MQGQSVLLTHGGVTLSISAWARRVGVSQSKISRLRAAGKSIDHILSLPVVADEQPKPQVTITHNGQTKTISEWSNETGITRETLWSRRGQGLSPAEILRPVQARTSRLVEIDGKARTLAEASELTGIPYAKLDARWERGLRGDDLLLAGRIPYTRKNSARIEIGGVFRTVQEWSAATGVSVGSIYGRLYAGKTGAALIAQTNDPGDDPVPEWKPTLGEPWEADAFAQDVVMVHPDGMTLESIGALLGLCCDRVRQIEAEALVKLRAQPGAIEALEALVLLRSTRKERVEPEPVYWGNAQQVGRAKRDRTKEAA